MSESFTFESQSEQQTLELAHSLARSLQPGDVLALEGPLGSGKTCFVRGLAQGLGIEPSRVSSPTFIICQEYSGAGDAKLIHIDAYRIRGLEELETIGWREMLEGRDAVMAVEWPSRIVGALPASRINIDFEHAGEHARRMQIRAAPDVSDRIQSLRKFSSGATATAAKCRTCGRPVTSDAAHFPFCSDRCKMADLGKWFSESYRTTRPIEADDELDE